MRKVSIIAVIFFSACTADDKDIPDDSAAHDSGYKLDEDGDGYTPEEGDCDDTDEQVNPLADEVPCDGVDNDCYDGDLDDVDGDGDACKGVGGHDCDDGDATVNSTAEDVCGDGIDSNCDGQLECDCDGDDYDGAQCSGSDCDDEDPAINKAAEDACYDGEDTDCQGNDDYDCDLDGYTSAEYGGDDCDDADGTLSPGTAEVCQDGIDNDCDATTPDCDCDGDGYDAVECEGTDCDDSDAAVNPDGDETTVDNVDDDCDTEIDEDAYCNVYSPFGNGTSASRTYDTLFLDGSSYTETVKITSYDAVTGDAQIARSLTSALTSYDLVEYHNCTDGLVSMSAFDATVSSIPIASISYSDVRTEFLAEADLVPDATWTYEYAANDGSTVQWKASGVYTVVGTDTITTPAGTFDAIEIVNDYDIVSSGSSSSDFSRSGTVTMYFVARLGLVYSEDLKDDGTEAEIRSLTAYTGYYP